MDRRRFNAFLLLDDDSDTLVLEVQGGDEVFGSASLSGTGDLTATGHARANASAVLTGVGALAATAHSVAYGAAVLSGRGSLRVGRSSDGRSTVLVGSTGRTFGSGGRHTSFAQ